MAPETNTTNIDNEPAAVVEDIVEETLTADEAAVPTPTPEEQAALLQMEAISNDESISYEQPEDDDEDDEDDEDDGEAGNGLSPEENELFEQLLRKTSFYAHKVKKASKQERKEMYRDENIITESQESKVKTSSTMLKEDMTQLNASAHGQRILEGKIVGVRTANADNKVATNLAEVRFGNGTVPVLIPDYLLFNFNVEKYRTPDGQNLVKNRIVTMIGTDIKFIVKQFDQKTKTAYADRLKAMDQEAYNNYIRPLNNTGKPRIKIGDKIQAKITAVSKNSVTVYAFGSETIILQNPKKDSVEVSWNHLADCRTKFQKNQIVNVRVLSIKVEEVEKYNEKYNLVATKLSIKQAEEDPQEKYFDDFVEGGFYQGVVTAVPDNGPGVFVVLNGKVDCLCSFPKFGVFPYVGQERIVEVTTKTTTDPSGNTVDVSGKPIRRLLGIFRDV